MQYKNRIIETVIEEDVQGLQAPFEFGPASLVILRPQNHEYSEAGPRNIRIVWELGAPNATFKIPRVKLVEVLNEYARMASGRCVSSCGRSVALKELTRPRNTARFYGET